MLHDILRRVDRSWTQRHVMLQRMPPQGFVFMLMPRIREFDAQRPHVRLIQHRQPPPPESFARPPADAPRYSSSCRSFLDSAPCDVAEDAAAGLRIHADAADSRIRCSAPPRSPDT